MLPFWNANITDTTISESESEVTQDEHSSVLHAKSEQLRIMHLNTQSMVSTFDEFILTINQFPFDIITLSETWLKDNRHLLDYVSIPGYVNLFRNRDIIRGGGVGIYLRDNIKFKCRKDIEKLQPDMEHIWLEIPGRNKNSKLLLGVTYRSEKILPTQIWLEEFENILANISAQWDGLLLITGDINIDLMNLDSTLTKQYIDILNMNNLQQMVTKPTRVTATSQTLIDHFITNCPNRITHTDVLPCPLVSDHSAPYVCVNARVTRFLPRYKYIRNEQNYNEVSFVEDVKNIPMNIVYGVDDPDEKLELFNTMFLNCLERHAPMKRAKITRPPAPWLKDESIKDLQKQRDKLRRETRHINDSALWNNYRQLRNTLKSKIKKAKKNFMQRALSNRNPKTVWQVIHRILKPNPQPLRQNPDDLNSYFANTAHRTVDATNKTIEELYALIASLPECGSNPCHLRLVTYQEVLHEIKSLRSDCSTGHDQIPVKFIKLVAEEIVSPLTHIINCCIEKEYFPLQWKIARIFPIPKTNYPTTNNDLRGISILPALSKIYEKLVLRQMVQFIDSEHLLPSHVSGFRRGHSTTTALISIRDDIIKAMHRGEVTIMVFDTVHFDIIIRKLHSVGFSQQFLRWMMNYLKGRQQYVQIDDKRSEKLNTNFGVPQGSILGPGLFNLYVADLADHLGEACSCHQYADDTTIYKSVKPKDLQKGVTKISDSLKNLVHWSDGSKLAINNDKTKTMLITVMFLLLDFISSIYFTH